MARRAPMARNESILTRILAGESLRHVARAYGISPERVRQIVGWQARSRNQPLYDDLMADIATVSLVLLRQHAVYFMEDVARVREAVP